MQISIPNPCSQSLQEMKPIEGGVHCDVCSHAVIDFRNWSENEIQDYFKNKPGKTCGIFKKEQTLEDKTVVITPSINYSRLSFTQQFLCALFICFGSWLFSGCNMFDAHTTGEPLISTELQAPTKGDSEQKTRRDSLYTFHCKPIKHPKQETLKGNVKQIDSIPVPEIMGDIIYVEPNEIQEGITNPNERVWENPEEYASFPTGQEGLSDFLKNNITYPSIEKLNGIEGTVYVQFVVDPLGNVIKPEILRSVNNAPNFDIEVIRVIQKMPRWKPAKQDGKAVKSIYKMPVKFKLT